MWKQFKNTNYEVSNLGEVRNIKSKRILKTWNHKGYRMLSLQINKERKNYLVHRIIAETFIIGFDNTKPVHHINGIRDDNKTSNLVNIETIENLNLRVFLGKHFTQIDYIKKSYRTL